MLIFRRYIFKLAKNDFNMIAITFFGSEDYTWFLISES